MTEFMRQLLKNLDMVVVEEMEQCEVKNSPCIEVKLEGTDYTDWEDIAAITTYHVHNSIEMARFAELCTVLHKRGSNTECSCNPNNGSSVCCGDCDICPYNTSRKMSDDDTRDALMGLVTLPKWSGDESINLYHVEMTYIDENGFCYQIGDIDDPQFDESFPITLNRPS